MTKPATPRLHVELAGASPTGNDYVHLYALGRAVKMVKPRIEPTAFVHSMACVDDSVFIGSGSKVWQFASVIRGTVLGQDCVVAATACLDGPIIGDRVIVSPGVDMGPGFVIEDDVFIGPHAVLCNDFWPRAHKRGFDYDALRSGEIVSIRVCDGASIGAGAKIMPGVTIGNGAMIAANAVVTANVPDGCLWTRDGDIRAIRDEQMITRVRAC